MSDFGATMEGSPRPNPLRSKIRCSFCDKSRDEVSNSLFGPSGISICNECVELCNEVIEEEQRGRYQV